MTYPVTVRCARDATFPHSPHPKSCDPITLADHLEASIDLLEIEDSTTLMVPAVDGVNSEEAKSLSFGLLWARNELGCSSACRDGFRAANGVLILLEGQLPRNQQALILQYPIESVTVPDIPRPLADLANLGGFLRDRWMSPRGLNGRNKNELADNPSH
jgi:hypothetical protein